MKIIFTSERRRSKFKDGNMTARGRNKSVGKDGYMNGNFDGILMFMASNEIQLMNLSVQNLY